MDKTKDEITTRDKIHHDFAKDVKTKKTNDHNEWPLPHYHALEGVH